MDKHSCARVQNPSINDKRKFKTLFCKANFDRDTRKRLFNNFCIQVANIVYMYFFIQYDIETKEFRYDIIIGNERDNSDVGAKCVRGVLFLSTHISKLSN